MLIADSEFHSHVQSPGLHAAARKLWAAADANFDDVKLRSCCSFVNSPDDTSHSTRLQVPGRTSPTSPQTTHTARGIACLRFHSPSHVLPHVVSSTLHVRHMHLHILRHLYLYVSLPYFRYLHTYIYIYIYMYHTVSTLLSAHEK